MIKVEAAMFYPNVNGMPIITSSGVVIASALLPVFAAAAAIASPVEREAYTALGAAVGTFLAVAYMRIKDPSRVSFMALAFTGVSTLFVGWILPEPLAWWAVWMGWLNEPAIESLPRKMWAVAALACSLAGTTLILTGIYWFQKKMPSLILREETATVRLSDDTELELKRTKFKRGHNKAPE